MFKELCLSTLITLGVASGGLPPSNAYSPTYNQFEVRYDNTTTPRLDMDFNNNDFRSWVYDPTNRTFLFDNDISSGTHSYYFYTNDADNWTFRFEYQITSNGYAFLVYTNVYDALSDNFDKDPIYYAIKVTYINIGNDDPYILSYGMIPFSDSSTIFSYTELYSGGVYPSSFGDITLFLEFTYSDAYSTIRYDSGYSDGFTAGKDVGYVNGQNSASNVYNLFSSMADIPFITLRGLLNFDILGMNFYVILMSFVTLLFVFFVIRWFIK